MTCELDPPGDSNDLMYQIVTVSEICRYRFFVPTDHYRQAERFVRMFDKETREDV
jgi:hypothetical protein